ncbi:hypothetical protein MASR1M12_25520 [Erysipelotrichia bacterium]
MPNPYADCFAYPGSIVTFSKEIRLRLARIDSQNKLCTTKMVNGNFNLTDQYDPRNRITK